MADEKKESALEEFNFHLTCDDDDNIALKFTGKGGDVAKAIAYVMEENETVKDVILIGVAIYQESVLNEKIV